MGNSQDTTQISKILGNIVKTGDVIGEKYKNVPIWYPKVIQIQGDDRYMIHMAFFLEQVFRALTDNDLLGENSMEHFIDLQTFGDDSDLSAIILEDKELEQCKTDDAKKAWKTIQELNTKEKTKTDPQTEYGRKTKMLANAVNIFCKAIFETQLQGATKRKPDETNQLISLIGVNTYDGVVSEIQSALNEVNCSYLVFASLIKQGKKLFNVQDAQLAYSEGEDQIQELDAAYDLEKALTIVPQDRKYNSFVSVCYEGKAYILISKFISESFPFAGGVVRTERGLNHNEQFQLSYLEKILERNNITEPGQDRFSATDKRKNEIIYQIGQGAMILFKLTALIKTRLIVMKPKDWERTIKNVEFPLQEIFSGLSVDHIGEGVAKKMQSKYDDVMYLIDGNFDEEREANNIAQPYFKKITVPVNDENLGYSRGYIMGIIVVKIKQLQYFSNFFESLEPVVNLPVKLDQDQTRTLIFYLSLDLQFVTKLLGQQNNDALEVTKAAEDYFNNEYLTYVQEWYKPEFEISSTKKWVDEFNKKLKNVKSSIKAFIESPGNVVKSDILNQYCKLDFEFEFKQTFKHGRHGGPTPNINKQKRRRSSTAVQNKNKWMDFIVLTLVLIVSSVIMFLIYLLTL